MDADELERRSRGTSRDMLAEAISRRIEIVSELYDLWKLLRTARRPDGTDSIAEGNGPEYRGGNAE